MKSSDEHAVSTRALVTGFAFAVLLTAIPFIAVWSRAIGYETTLAVIAAAALMQIAVHLRVFLGIRFAPSQKDSWVALVFAAILIFVTVGGTLWIMTNVARRMAH
jgi:cytochrome o ubiquinol oxidase subunit IV